MPTSFTLRVLAHSVSGLYVEERTGRGYRREEVLAAFPASVLDAHPRLTRMSDGIYCVEFPDGAAPSFRLHSRRRKPRVGQQARKAALGN